MKRLLTYLAIVMMLAAIGPPALAIQRFNQTQFTSGFWGQKVEWVWSYVTAGPSAIMVWKADSVVARAVKACTNAVAKALTDTLDWGPYHRLRIDADNAAGYSLACSVTIAGLDTTGAAQTEVLTFAESTAADTVKFSQKTWSKVRTVTWLGTTAIDSFLVYAYPVKCVTTTTSANSTALAGVLMDSVVAKTKYSGTAVDGYGRLCIGGIYPVKMSAAARRAGTMMATHTAAETSATATAADGAVLGKCLYATDATAGRYPVIINVE
jgi:hypothetical protein